MRRDRRSGSERRVEVRELGEVEVRVGGAVARPRRAPENPSKGRSDSVSRSCYKNMRFTRGFSWDLEFSLISPAARHFASVRSHLRCKFEGLARDESKMSDS